MKQYKHLTLAQRYEIQTLCKQGKTQKQIADFLNVSKSSISREIERNSASGKYEAEEAHRRYGYKKSCRMAYKLTQSVKMDIERGLQNDLSPEQIVGKAALDQSVMVSHETIYSYVYERQKEQKRLKENRLADEICWFSCLRTKRKKRHKRKNTYQNRAIIDLNPLKEAKVSIEQRPDIVNNKERIGDCEIDTIIGKDHKGAILTVVERVTKHTSIVKLPNKTDQAVTHALIQIAQRTPFVITSLTSDNGTEFADYANIKKQLNCEFYFAHPYSSWERGLKENTNGLIRQYIPKRSDFDLYAENYIRDIEVKLNNRPRKTLNFYSPLQKLQPDNILLTCCT